MKPILFVRCDAVDTLGVAPDAMLTSGAEIEVWDSVNPDTSRPDLTDIGGVVLLGSTYNIEHAEEQPFIKEVRELTLEAMDRRSRSWASASARRSWRGRSMPRSAGTPPRGGFEPMHPDPAAATDPLLGHYRDGDMVFQWHMDTFEPPAGSTMLATGDRVRNQAFRTGDRTWGVQWHFEIDRPELEFWLDTFSREGDLVAE
jgi:GMP synthase-like glutamine amidotransferase